MKYHIAWVAGFFSMMLGTAAAQVVSDSINSTEPSFWAYELLNIPDLRSIDSKDPVLIAVVDDGFNLNHEQLRPFIYRNPNEFVNGEDSDNNSFRDDINGWDVGDHDNDVSIPKGREQFFYHGTMVTGVITRVAQQAFGDKASDLVKILPVKSLKDEDQRHDYTLGYGGIRYAVNAGADIVICAWGGGRFNSEKHDEVFRQAEEKGVLILAAAGNFYSERCDPPASISSVYAIAAVDSALRKTTRSNYGAKIDLSAGGELVYAPHPAGQNTYGYLDETSAASALVGGCAAVLKAVDGDADPRTIIMALKNTATPIDQLNLTQAGRMGAGTPDLGKAAKYIKDKSFRPDSFDGSRSEGSIVLSKKSETGSWTIQPKGGYEGFEFRLFGKWPQSDDRLTFRVDGQTSSTYALNEMPQKVFVEGQAVSIEFEGKLPKHQVEVEYSAVPIDSTRLYCNETNILEQGQGSISDGSGELHYANRSSCKWLIKVPVGKHIRLEFDAFDTEAKKDHVYVFRGSQTTQDDMMARFTGDELPPEIVVGSNEVLVWFVTNETGTRQGWNLNYQVTDESPGIKGVRKE